MTQGVFEARKDSAEGPSSQRGARGVWETRGRMQDLSAPLTAVGLLSLAAMALTRATAINMKDAFIKAGLFGIDLNKPQTKRDKHGQLLRNADGRPMGPVLPEGMGVVAGTAYLAAMVAFIPFAFAGGRAVLGSSISLARYLSAQLAICCMCFLGFADDVLELRWRERLWLPLIASFPLLMVYVAEGGGTTIVLPHFVARALGIGPSIDIGVAYYAFMSSLAIFCTNSINILAGVNGLEVGQSIIIGVTIALNNAIQLWRWPQGPLHDNNLFSLCLTIPFLCTSAALFALNWCPARIFVGDTYCYFAGMTFAVVGILGHNSKTVLLFFLPQIVNFLYSIPQLFRLIPCPRHRMPGYIPATDQLKMSLAEFNRHSLSAGGKLVLRTCEMLSLGYIETQPGGHVRMSNMTIINLALHWCGPMREPQLTRVLLTFQAACSVLALSIRHCLAWLIYEQVF